MPLTVRELLKSVCFRRMDVDWILDTNSQAWVTFDPELGYLPRNAILRDGMDGACSTYRYAPEGHRKQVNYADQPCRINTYGNSFTQCQQVSDGESWQEVLAAHLGEPIRNFGSGGYGVNQAYLRARRMEAGDCAAPWVILNIYNDDHVRNLDASRWIRTTWKELPLDPNRPHQMHGLPCAHVRYELQTGAFAWQPAPCKNAEDLLALCDPDCFCETFKNDPIVRLFTLEQGGDVDALDDLQALAERFKVDADLRAPARRANDALHIREAYALESTLFILDKLREWFRYDGKQLMILLSYGEDLVRLAIRNQPRFDQPLLDYLELHDIPYVDTLTAHVEDFKCFRVSLDDYLVRYYGQAAGAAVFGHYNPKGNHFFAFAVKNRLIDWLNPKPPAYRAKS